MKVEDLRTLNISSVDGWVDLKTKTPHGFFATSAAIPFGDYLTDFENEEKATEAAALFRAAYKMQEALKELAEVLKTEPFIHQTHPAIQKLYAALALSENTAETATT